LPLLSETLKSYLDHVISLPSKILRQQKPLYHPWIYKALQGLKIWFVVHMTKYHILSHKYTLFKTQQTVTLFI